MLKKLNPMAWSALSWPIVVAMTVVAVMISFQVFGQTQTLQPKLPNYPAYEVVRKNWVPDGRSGSFYLRVYCSPGNRVVGGGFNLGSSNMHALRSFPIYSADLSQLQGWETYIIDNSSTKDYAASVYVICMKLSN